VTSSEGTSENQSNGASNHPQIPKATHAGNLTIGDSALPCAVLEDGTRVLSERGVTAALGGKRGGAHWKRLQRAAPDSTRLPLYLSAGNIEPFIPASLRMALAKPIKYRPTSGSGSGANGVNATLLPEICEVLLKARRHGALLPSQEHLAAQAEILLGGLANVGIIARVDEATGYQEIRNRDELHRILEAYISKELLPWTKRFPDDFYQELFRLRGWPYNPPSPKRPAYVGKLTNEIVYSKLPPGVLQQLQERNPVGSDGRRRHKHHQLLTEDIGNPHLEKHLVGVITLMRVSATWSGFKRLLDKAFPTPGQTMQMDFGDGEDGSA
jgi:hypothetical protein